jgi:ubiquinone/menaquinone biosynthesis C-methylase UbiE
MWRLRSSIASADYDERAFESRIFLQRYWQRKRFEVIRSWVSWYKGVLLDVGSGSSRILQGMPQAIGLDIALTKLRYMKRKHLDLVQGSLFSLPFTDESIDVLICSQVIEHVREDRKVFQEIARVLRWGGHLIIGTPDYGRPYWPLIEKAYKFFHPNGYADEHITHYTDSSLRDGLQREGFEILEHHYILGSELNVLARKVKKT